MSRRRRRQLGGIKDTLAKVPKPVWYGLGALVLIALFTKRKTIASAASRAGAAVSTSLRSFVASIVTANSVRKAVPGVSITALPSFIGPLVDALAEAAINTPARIAAFLAQVGTESGSFARFVENLNYSADGLLKTFPKYFPTKALAESYARQPQKIASRVYGGRMGNGPEESGDGWRYRGRGPIQLTGKNNYAAFTKDVGSKFGVDFVANPDLLADPVWGFRAAAWYWNQNNLNQYADVGDIDSISKVVNAGSVKKPLSVVHGLEDRRQRYAAAKTALAQESAVV